MSIRITYFESSSCSFIPVWSFQNPAVLPKICSFLARCLKKKKQNKKQKKKRDDKKKEEKRRKKQKRTRERNLTREKKEAAAKERGINPSEWR